MFNSLIDFHLEILVNFVLLHLVSREKAGPLQVSECEVTTIWCVVFDTEEFGIWSYNPKTEVMAVLLS